MTRLAQWRAAGAVLVLAMGTFLAVADEPKVEEGFVSIFDGKSLAGWTVIGKPEGFTVKDGILRSEGAKGGNWIRSEKEYGDFILRMEWKVSKGGNSGVFIRSAKEGNPWETGYECQILDDETRDDAHCTGSLYGYFAVAKRPDTTPDVWHKFEIRCQGTKIKVTSDDTVCVDVDEKTNEKAKDKPKKGYLGLQDSHSTAGHYIEFRNIRIKSL
jgi:hypothetical protein